MKITDDILYVGVNDHQVDLFEGQYVVPHGMSYNSYVIRDEKIAVMDTVDAKFTHEWLDNLSAALEGRKPDYLIVQHMEPDHAANIHNFMKVYPDTTVVANVKTFAMIQSFFRDLDLEGKKLEVKNGDSLSLGRHTLTFVFAPMVHWPEVMVTYDSTEKVLFSADGFGKFGALDVEEDWDDEARRYYIGIVGKYGAQVQNLLKAAATLDIQTICPLHGPVLKENLGHYLEKYNIWSSYAVESEGVMIAYTSVYGHTSCGKRAAWRWWSATWPARTWPRRWRTPSATASWCWPPPPTTPRSSPLCGTSSSTSPSATTRSAPWASSRTAAGPPWPPR